MATRDSFVETVADGDQLNDGYFNGVVLHLGLRQSTSSEYTTEQSTAVTQGNWADTGFSATFTPPNSITRLLIHGLKIIADIKTGVNTEEVYYRVKMVNNTTSGTIYFYNSNWSYSSGGGVNPQLGKIMNTSSSTYAQTTQYAHAFNVVLGADANDGQFFVGPDNTLTPIIGGSTYTITIEASTDESGGATAYVDDVTLSLYWQPMLDEATEGWS